MSGDLQQRAIELESFRDYLRVLAKLSLDDRLRAKLDPSDIVQQTMLEAYRAISHYNGSTDAELAGWLRAILARNIADQLKYFTRAKRNIRIEQSLERSIELSSYRMEIWQDARKRSDKSIMNSDEVILLADALARLPQDQRIAVEQYYLAEMPAYEVSNRLGRSEASIAGLLRRGLKRLRELMREDEES